MTTKLCNMTYTGDDGVTQRECQGDATGPRPAKYIGRGIGFGARVCSACWPEVKAKLVMQARGPPALAMLAVEQAFRVVR